MIPAAKHQLNEILRKEHLAPGIALFEVYTPLVARTVLAGQFVVVRADDYAERIPLTVADRHLENGTITLIVQIVGLSTRKMERFQVGDAFLDIIGPLGRPMEVRKAGTVVCIGGGVGVAPVYPITKAFREAGNRIISIIGARNKEMI
ncbi:MAG: sulfide/dihydroorotate dehydrogenase-like FAD/NAD-binding protein, partial [Candidatus Aminicenantes bacterium]|nr:sulfide/dihydroorotate dehydrogenase-like FAD/NAD-binding protein [Candidatus Aminicenantes bacterium]